MSTTAIPTPAVLVAAAESRPPARLRRTLALRTGADAPDVLMRVLSLLLRRPASSPTSSSSPPTDIVPADWS
jgi:hypothetical protein